MKQVLEMAPTECQSLELKPFPLLVSLWMIWTDTRLSNDVFICNIYFPSKIFGLKYSFKYPFH